MMEVKRFEIYLVTLNPTVESEIRKTRPCIVISPNEMHRLNTVIIAPLTSKGFGFLFRPKIRFQDKDGLVLLDQICTVDKQRLIKKNRHSRCHKSQRDLRSANRDVSVLILPMSLMTLSQSGVGL